MLLAPIGSFRVCISHQSDRRIRVCISHRSERRFALWFKRCSNFAKVMGNSVRAVSKVQSSFRMRNVGSSVFSTCILPRFMRNVILLDR